MLKVVLKNKGSPQTHQNNKKKNRKRERKSNGLM
jgi:hypothetical protein